MSVPSPSRIEAKQLGRGICFNFSYMVLAVTQLQRIRLVSNTRMYNRRLEQNGRDKPHQKKTKQVKQIKVFKIVNSTLVLQRINQYAPKKCIFSVVCFPYALGVSKKSKIGICYESDAFLYLKVED